MCEEDWEDIIVEVGDGVWFRLCKGLLILLVVQLYWSFNSILLVILVCGDHDDQPKSHQNGGILSNG